MFAFLVLACAVCSVSAVFDRSDTSHRATEVPNQRVCLIFKDGRSDPVIVNNSTVFGDDSLKTWTVDLAVDFPYKDFIAAGYQRAPEGDPSKLTAKYIYSKKFDFDASSPGYALVAVPVLDSVSSPKSSGTGETSHEIVFDDIQWTILPHKQNDTWYPCQKDTLYYPQDNATIIGRQHQKS
ncbi:hypothetical protein PYCC9005_003450 [Savitreella phatthalungensis]